ncbi:putative ligase domain protein [Mycobacterium ulcerans str. Harvey]|uniref:Ligase domain protein n=1 Tax=Mycobacterium ulcerans str. Harvey TaxID=1299332 RepID=A0ABP3A5C7_MYCUL|nr:putative ligase domain protein [Mycobacterium ulcerans str. Harvey]
MSRFTEKMFRNARETTKGMVTGEPHTPVRHTWGEVHERARQIAGGLAAAGVGPATRSACWPEPRWRSLPPPKGCGSAAPA